MATIARSRVLTPVDVGPWPHGLNNRDSNYSARDIQDSELVSCSNLDVKENGTLVSRPGFAVFNSPSVFTDIVNDGSSIALRNILGKVRLESNYDEALVQVVASNTGNTYILKTSLTDGEYTDFSPGYWIKKAWAVGHEFFLTSVVRYDSVLYFTSNNQYLTSPTTFTGGFSRDAETKVGSAFVALANDNFTYLASDTNGNIFAIVPGPGDGSNTGKIVKIAPNATITDFIGAFELPSNIHIHKATNDIYISAQSTSHGAGTVLKITPAAVESIIQTQISQVYYQGVVVDNNNVVWYQSHAVTVGAWKLNSNANNTVTQYDTLYGNAYNEMVITSDGYTIYGIDPGGTRIYKASIGGPGVPANQIGVTTIWMDLTALGMSGAKGLSIDNSDNLYLGSNSDPGRVWQITPSKIVSEYYKPVSDGTYTVVDSAGNLYVQCNLGLFKITSPVATMTAIPGMPFGDVSFILKDRMFIVNKTLNRIYYSKTTDPTLWTTNDGGGFFDVEPGDGLDINDVAVVNDEIFVFKDTKTFIFSFTADPGLDGYLRLLSVDRGAYSVSTFNNVIYLVGAQGVQQLINGYFVDISQQVMQFHNNISPQSTISVANNKLYVSITGNENFLVMNLLTGAWSTYNIMYPDKLIPINVYSHLIPVGSDKFVFLGSSQTSATALALWGIGTKYDLDVLVSPPQISATTYLLPQYSMKTKIYDFGSPLLWKRMMKFIVDVASKLNLYNFYGGRTVNVKANLSSSVRTDESLIAIPSNGNDVEHKLPVQQLPTIGYSSFRFQTVSFDLNSDSVGNIAGPITDSASSHLTVKKFSGYILQKGSKAEGNIGTD